MKINHTFRVTISLPEYLHERLLQIAPHRGVSHIVVQALERYLHDIEKSSSIDPAEEFLRAKNALPKLSFEEIQDAIQRGRK